jgi:hypothetical protein
MLAIINVPSQLPKELEIGKLILAEKLKVMQVAQ